MKRLPAVRPYQADRRCLPAGCSPAVSLFQSRLPSRNRCLPAGRPIYFQAKLMRLEMSGFWTPAGKALISQTRCPGISQKSCPGNKLLFPDISSRDEGFIKSREASTRSFLGNVGSFRCRFGCWRVSGSWFFKRRGPGVLLPQRGDNQDSFVFREGAQKSGSWPREEVVPGHLL